MGLEQPKFDLHDTQEEKEVSQESVPSTTGEKRRSNVIEGPWPKREEPRPEVKEPSPNELVPRGNEAALEKLHRELLEISDKGEISSKAEDTATKPEEPEEDEKERHHFVEGLETFERCGVCGGSGRRWFIFKCPVCRGLGRVTTSSSRREGYYDVEGKNSQPEDNRG